VFGDIQSDLAGAIAGSPGIAPTINSSIQPGVSGP
jgi:isocitrate/isopropylmalate dehydrogenase